MFNNFIYFIIVILIYATHKHSESTNFSAIESLLLFFSLILIYASFSWIQFHRLLRSASRKSFARLDHQINAAITRLSVLAVVLFAIDIYGLNLTSFLANIYLFRVIPTLQAFIFIGLFIFYLSIIWICAHPLYQHLYHTDLSRRAYVFSNVSFAIPVVLPWLCLSGIADLIHILPFESLKRFLATTQGEVTYFLTFLFTVAVIGPAMIQKFWRCKPLETGAKRSRIEYLCRRAGLEYSNILYWPIFGGRMITAGVMGLIKRFRYILVTDALLRFLDADEIEAVIAHEIGHIKRRHLWFYLLFFVGYLILSYATFDLIIFLIIYSEAVYSFINRTGFDQATVTSAIFSLIIIVIFLIYFRYIFGYFMRNFERQADCFVFALFDSAKPLISSLEKIAVTSGLPLDKPNWHHFSIAERTGYLQKCESDRSWIDRHDRKIRKSITAYLIGILFVGGIGYNLNYGDTGNQLSQRFLKTIILRELQHAPDTPSLHSALGDLYYSGKNYAEAIAAYERSIVLAPANPTVLNNLAWLYATCEENRFRDPKKALRLAKKAADLKAEPHILDTLAESYYVNGDYEAAVWAERQALNLTPRNRSYYVGQLDKFLKAAGKD